MPKPQTFPILYDNLQTISISFLTKHGYLRPNQWQSGTVSWSRNGNEIGDISITVDTFPENLCLELRYTCNGSLINYKVELIPTISNLGKGVVWVFLCPRTHKRCRKLYLIDTLFLHRTAYSGCMYKVQTESKYNRQVIRKCKPYWKGEDYDQLQAKHFKRFYNGKPTKRYLRLLKKFKKLNNYLK
jgi:hypothetical protein